jgi:hypothetical protein
MMMKRMRIVSELEVLPAVVLCFPKNGVALHVCTLTLASVLPACVESEVVSNCMLKWAACSALAGAHQLPPSTISHR